MKETFDHYQEYAKAGRDPEFGRDAKFLHELEGDTYYVIEQKLRFCTTMGGYEATKDMQLLDNDFKPVANFYTAGELVGGANGKDSMPSMINSWSYASSFVAGTAAADNANNYAVNVVTSASHELPVPATNIDNNSQISPGPKIGYVKTYALSFLAAGTFFLTKTC